MWGGGGSDMMEFVWDTLDFYGHAWCQCSGSGKEGWGVCLAPQVLVYGFSNKKMAAERTAWWSWWWGGGRSA